MNRYLKLGTLTSEEEKMWYKLMQKKKGSRIALLDNKARKFDAELRLVSETAVNANATRAKCTKQTNTKTQRSVRVHFYCVCVCVCAKAELTVCGKRAGSVCVIVCVTVFGGLRSHSPMGVKCTAALSAASAIDVFIWKTWDTLLK